MITGLCRGPWYLLGFIASRRVCSPLTSGKMWGVTVQPRADGRAGAGPEAGATCAQAQPSASACSPPSSEAPCPLSLVGMPWLISFSTRRWSKVSFLRDAGSSLWRKKYYHFSLIFSHSCTNRASQLSKALLTSTKPRQAAGNTAQKRVPRSLGSGSQGRHHTCAHPAWVHVYTPPGYTSSTFSAGWSLILTTPHGHQDKCHILPRTENRTEWLVRQHPAGHDGAESKGPGRLASSILLCKLQCSPISNQTSRRESACGISKRKYLNM